MLLQYHGQLEMQEAIRNAFMHNFQTMMGAHVETVNPLLILHVHRNSIVQDAISQVKTKERKKEFESISRFQLDKYKDDDFKKPLQVYFHNEEGLDAGGIRKEFFLLLTKEILNPKYGMFSKTLPIELQHTCFSFRLAVYQETNTIWFSDYYEEDEEPMYKLIGVKTFLYSRIVKNIFIFRLFALWLYIISQSLTFHFLLHSIKNYSINRKLISMI